MIELDTHEVTDFLKKMVATLSPPERIEILTIVGKRIGTAAEGVVSPYPEASGNALEEYYTRVSKKGIAFKSKFKSLKQQRKVMAMVGKGLIPYKRTGGLGQSITSQIVSVTANDVESEVGTNKDYSPYVLDKERQSHYHSGTWNTLQDDISGGATAIAGAGVSAYSAEMDRRLK